MSAPHPIADLGERFWGTHERTGSFEWVTATSRWSANDLVIEARSVPINAPLPLR